MAYKESEYLQVSGIQHYLFCRRQWALIHIENQWAENVLTVSGNILHETAHSAERPTKRGDVIITYSMPVFSPTLGVSGMCDVVEFHKGPNGTVINGFDGRFVRIRSNTNAVRPKRILRMSFSYAPKLFAWNKCCAAIFPKVLYTMAKRADGWRSCLQMSFETA